MTPSTLANSQKPRPLNVELRRFDDCDVETALAIEQQSYPRPWERDELRRAAREEWQEGLAARLANQLVGYVFFYVRPMRYDVLRLAVAPAYRRRAVGLQLLAAIQAKATIQEMSVRAEIWEYHDDGQRLLRAAGFRCTEIMRDFYCEEGPIDGHSAYRFEWNPNPQGLSLVCPRAPAHAIGHESHACSKCGAQIIVSPAVDDAYARVPTARFLCTECGRKA